MRNHFEAPESIEARAIMRLVSLGTATLDDARDLISVPEGEEQALTFGETQTTPSGIAPSLRCQLVRNSSYRLPTGGYHKGTNPVQCCRVTQKVSNLLSIVNCGAMQCPTSYRETQWAVRCRARQESPDSSSPRGQIQRPGQARHEDLHDLAIADLSELRHKKCAKQHFFTESSSDDLRALLQG